MSRQVAPDIAGSDVFDRLAVKIREIARQEHTNHGSGAEKFTVRSVNPLIVEQLEGDLMLQDGDPDFTVGAWVRQYELNYGLTAGDQVWVLREGQTWHLVDIADPGGQRQWDTGTPGD